MSAGDPADVHRSLRRYVWLMLGGVPNPASSAGQWTVRLQRTRVADEERPVAIVEPGVLTTPFARHAVNQGDVQKMQPFTVVCYPVVGDDAVASGETARELGSLLDAGFTRGLVTTDNPPKGIGAPFRVPVYDYAAVPIEGAGRAGPADPYMYADVDQSFNVRPIQDALDELRYTVVANLRLSWWAGGRVPPAAPIATSLPGTWTDRVRAPA